MTPTFAELALPLFTPMGSETQFVLVRDETGKLSGLIFTSKELCELYATRPDKQNRVITEMNSWSAVVQYLKMVTSRGCRSIDLNPASPQGRSYSIDALEFLGQTVRLAEKEGRQ